MIGRNDTGMRSPGQRQQRHGVCYARHTVQSSGYAMPHVSSSNRLVTIAAYPRKLLQLFESEWQIEPGPLLEGSHLTVDQLDRPDRLVPLVDVFMVFHNAARLCPESDLALRYAERLPPSAHGLLGMATLTAPSLRAVIDLYYDYMAVVAPFMLLHQETRRNQQQLIFELMTELPAHEAFVMELMLAAAFNITERLLGERVREISLHLTCPPPPHAARLQEHCRGTVHFNASFNGLGVPLHLLDAPNASADPEAHAGLLRQINERMDQLLARGSFVDAVGQYLQRHDGPLPRMNAVADAFNLSVRTFRNRLSQHGTSFQQLLDSERQTQARHLLSETEVSVKEIAYRLGFQESSNFSRVFKRWTGMTPLDYRQSHARPRGAD